MGDLPLEQAVPNYALFEDLRKQIEIPKDETLSRTIHQDEKAKVVLSGKIERAVTLKGVMATKGAQAAIEAAGGKLEA